MTEDKGQIIKKRGIMKISGLAKRMVTSILIISLICIIISVIYYRSVAFLPFFLGVLISSTTSILKVFMLERTVDNIMSMEKKKVGNYAGLQHILRLLISGIAFFIGAVVPQISLLGVVAGVFAFQLSLYTIRTWKNE